MSKTGQDIPQGQPQDVIGGGIDGSVVKQLIAREKLVSTPKKDKNQLLFFNGNGAWARLVSSINTITKEETQALATGTKTIKEVVGNKNLAYNNVLMGGALKQGTSSEPTSLGGGVNQAKHNPVNINNEGYITAGDFKDSSYHNYESLGFRPTPGINSVSVKSKGTYGSLREAEVNVTVWTLEDLEMMQALYLRPGFTILLEWGHSLQLDSETGTVNKDIQVYKKFLRNKVPKDIIQNDLRDIAFDSDYNYDSMVGYVSNFNWSFRDDGGYDCMVKIISSGTVLESIAVTFDTSNVYPPDQLASWNDDKGKKERRSIYHKLFTELEHLSGNPGSGFAEVKQNTVEFIDSAAAATDALVEGDFNLAGELALDAAEDFTEIFTGDDEDAFERLTDVQSTRGKKILSEDPEFLENIERILGKKFAFWNYKGTTYSWTERDPFCSLEEEEAEDFLESKFGDYGFKFEQSGVTGDWIIVTSRFDSSISKEFGFDTETAQGTRKNTYDLADFLIENARTKEEEKERMLSTFASSAGMTVEEYRAKFGI